MSFVLWVAVDLRFVEAWSVRVADRVTVCVWAIFDFCSLILCYPPGSWRKLNSSHVLRIRPIGPRGCSAWSVHILLRWICPRRRIAMFFDKSLGVDQSLFCRVRWSSVCSRERPVVRLRFQCLAYIRLHRADTPILASQYISSSPRGVFGVFCRDDKRAIGEIASQLKRCVPRSGCIWLSVYRRRICFSTQAHLASIWSVSGFPVFLAVLWENRRSPDLTCFRTCDHGASVRLFAFEVCSSGLFGCGIDAARRDYSLRNVERFQFSQVCRVVRLIFDFWESS